MTTATAKERALLVGLTIGIPSGRKTDKGLASEVTNNHSAASETASVSKQIIPKAGLEPLKKLVGATRDWHYKHSSPWGDDGRRFLPNKAFFTYQGEILKRKGQFETLRDAFLADYDNLKAQAQGQLGSMFNADDYATAEEIADKFTFKSTFDPIPSGADLRLDLEAEALAEMRKELDDRVASATRGAQLDLYRRLAEPLTAMVERLSDPENVFRDSLVGNLQEVCEIIPTLNMDDSLLESLVEKARGLTVHAPETLRNDQAVRSDIAKRAAEIAERMKGFCAR